MMVVVSRLIGKKVENYLFKVGETRQTSTRHVQNIRWSGFFFAQNWFYNYMRKKTCYILILSKQNSANNSQFKIYPSKNCSSFNQSQHDSKNLTNAVKEEQKIYWYISDLVRASYFKGGLISESFWLKPPKKRCLSFISLGVRIILAFLMEILSQSEKLSEIKPPLVCAVCSLKFKADIATT